MQTWHARIKHAFTHKRQLYTHYIHSHAYHTLTDTHISYTLYKYTYTSHIFIYRHTHITHLHAHSGTDTIRHLYVTPITHILNNTHNIYITIYVLAVLKTLQISHIHTEIHLDIHIYTYRTHTDSHTHVHTSHIQHTNTCSDKLNLCIKHTYIYTNITYTHHKDSLKYTPTHQTPNANTLSIMHIHNTLTCIHASHAH